MAPEYGATIGFSLLKLVSTLQRPDEARPRCVTELLHRSEMFGIPRGVNASTALWWSSILPQFPRGPKRPQDRIDLENVKGFAWCTIPDSSRVWKPANEIGVNRNQKIPVQ